MVLTATVLVLRAVCKLTSVLLFFNLPNDPEHTDPGVGIIKQFVISHGHHSSTYFQPYHQDLGTQLSPVGPPEAYIQPWKLSHEKSEGWFITRIFGTIICAFCPIALSCSAAPTADPAPFLLPVLSQCTSAGSGCISKTLMKNKGMVGMSHCLFLWTTGVWFFSGQQKKTSKREKWTPAKKWGEGKCLWMLANLLCSFPML